MEAYKSPQEQVSDEKTFRGCSNNRLLMAVTLSGPDFVREGVNSIEEWAKKNRMDCAVFRGRSY